MIRINLLPTKKHQETEDSKRQLLLFGVLLVVVCVVLYFPLQWKQAELAEVKGKNTQTQNEITKLKETLSDVEKSTKERDSMKEQLNVLMSLERDRSGPVRYLRCPLKPCDKLAFMRTNDSAALTLSFDGCCLSQPLSRAWVEYSVCDVSEIW